MMGYLFKNCFDYRGMKPNGAKTYAKGSKHPEIDLVLCQKCGVSKYST